MRNKIWFFRIIGLCMMFIAVTLWGQEEDPAIDIKDINEVSLEDLLNVEIQSVSKFKQEVQKAPATVIVITQQQIQDRGYMDLSDVLKDIPGFDILDNAGRFGEFYTIRGIEGNDRFLVLVDGHKVNPSSGTFLSMGNSFSIRFARQIEIIYGPASAMYGADAFSGIINIIPSKPKEKSYTTLGLNFGSMNRLDVLLNGCFRLNKDFTISVMGRMIKTDGPDFTGKGYNEYDSMVSAYVAPQKAAFEQPIMDHNAFVKLQYKNITLEYFRQYFNEGNGLGMSPSFYVFNKENKWALATDMIWGIYKKEFMNGGTLIADFSYVSHWQDPDTYFYKWNRANNTTSGTFKQYMTGKDKTVKGVFSYNQQLSRDIQFIAGVEYEHSTSVPPYANDEVLGNSYKYEGTHADLINETLTIKEDRYAGFGQLTYSLGDKADIVLGGRYDYSSRYKGTFNPRVGLIVRPTATTHIKCLYGSAFQAPSLFYQYEQFGIPTFAFRSTNEIITSEDATWKLKNQKLKTYELSLIQNIGKKIQLNFSVYHNQLNDLIERVIYDRTGSTWNKYFNTYTNGQRNENIGIQKITGTNVMLNVVLSSRINGYFSHSYTDAIAEKSSGDVPVARVAKHKIWTGVVFSKLFKYVTIAPRFKWVGDMNTAPTNTIYPAGTQPGYTSLDMHVSVKNLLKHTNFYCFMGNVLDSKIKHAGLFEQAGVYASYVPQVGFYFHIGMEVNL